MQAPRFLCRSTNYPRCGRWDSSESGSPSSAAPRAARLCNRRQVFRPSGSCSLLVAEEEHRRTGAPIRISRRRFNSSCQQRAGWSPSMSSRPMGKKRRSRPRRRSVLPGAWRTIAIVVAPPFCATSTQRSPLSERNVGALLEPELVRETRAPVLGADGHDQVWPPGNVGFPVLVSSVISSSVSSGFSCSDRRLRRDFNRSRSYPGRVRGWSIALAMTTALSAADSPASRLSRAMFWPPFSRGRSNDAVQTFRRSQCGDPGGTRVEVKPHSAFSVRRAGVRAGRRSSSAYQGPSAISSST